MMELSPNKLFFILPLLLKTLGILSVSTKHSNVPLHFLVTFIFLPKNVYKMYKFVRNDKQAPNIWPYWWTLSYWYHRAGSQIEEFERPSSEAAFHRNILTKGNQLFDVGSTGVPCKDTINEAWSYVLHLWLCELVKSEQRAGTRAQIV